jgi:hypothetical protein
MAQPPTEIRKLLTEALLAVIIVPLAFSSYQRLLRKVLWFTGQLLLLVLRKN